MHKHSHNLFYIQMVVALVATAIAGCSKNDYKQDYNPLIDDPKQGEEEVPQ